MAFNLVVQCADTKRKSVNEEGAEKEDGTVLIVKSVLVILCFLTRNKRNIGVGPVLWDDTH